MNIQLTDFTVEGVGKIVLLRLPDAVSGDGRGRVSSMDRTTELREKLQTDIGHPVGFTAGDVNFLEFFWHKDYDSKMINTVLAQILAENPDVSIHFQGKSAITM